MNAFPPRAVRSLRRPVAALSLLSALATAIPAAAAPATQTMSFAAPDSRVSIEATGWFGINTIAGGIGPGPLPLVLRVVNGTDRDIEVEFGSGGFAGMGYGRAVIRQTTIRVPAHATVSETALVDPLVDRSTNSNVNPSLFLSFDGGGSRYRAFVRVMQVYSAVSAPLPGVPSAEAGAAPAATVPRVYSSAALRAIAPPDTGSAAVSAALEGEIDVAAAPSDWRGWMALSELVITDDEWTALPAAERRALLGWVALGGVLDVVAVDLDPGRLDRIGLPRAGGSGRRTVGAGEVVPVAADRSTWDAFHDAGGGPMRRDPHGTWTASGFAGRAGFSARELPFAPILGFLAVFAVVAGPVNVMLFAGRRRPARMFWTTPVISLAAAALLLGLMLVRDGFGGGGARLTLCVVDPDRNTSAVLQQQFSRTGILLGRAFPIRETSRMHPEFAGTNTVGVLVDRSGATFDEIADVRRTGDWFTSRSDQAFTLQALRSGRGRLELAGSPDAPEIVSSIDSPLARVLVIDAQGRPWRHGPLDAGRRGRLEPATEADVAGLRGELAGDAAPRLASAIDRLLGLPGFAWAESADPAGVAIATHGAIRWASDRAWFVVPVGGQEGP